MHGLPDWNAIRYDREQLRGHVESYFVKANDAEGRRAIWLKATIVASNRRPGHARAEAWAVVFDRQRQHIALKNTVPFASARFPTKGLNVAIGESLRFDTNGSSGSIERGGHKLCWDLTWKHDGSALVHFPIAKMYTHSFPKTKLVSPYPHLQIKGRIRIDDEEVEVYDWKGMQGHNWGSGHAEQYAWGHCNQWDQQVDCLLEAVSARIKVGPVMTPLVTLVCVRHEGREYLFTHPRDLLRNRGELHSRRCFFCAKNKEISIECDISAATDDFVGLYYPNPDGKMTYCLNSKLANSRVRIELPGKEPIDLTSTSAALEIGTRNALHGVKMYT